MNVKKMKKISGAEVTKNSRNIFTTLISFTAWNVVQHQIDIFYDGNIFGCSEHEDVDALSMDHKRKH